MGNSEQLLALDNKTIITEKQELFARWKDYFATLLNKPSTMEHAVDNIKQRPPQHWMCKYPDLDKLSSVISLPRKGKSSGADGQHLEVFRRSGGKLVEGVYPIIKGAWENLEVSADWNDAQLVTIFKKEDRRDFGNNCGTSLLSKPEKMFTHILFNR